MCDLRTDHVWAVIQGRPGTELTSITQCTQGNVWNRQLALDAHTAHAGFFHGFFGVLSSDTAQALALGEVTHSTSQVEALVHVAQLMSSTAASLTSKHSTLSDLGVFALDFQLNVDLANLFSKALHFGHISVVEVALFKFSGFFHVFTLLDVLLAKCLQIFNWKVSHFLSVLDHEHRRLQPHMQGKLLHSCRSSGSRAQ